MEQEQSHGREKIRVKEKKRGKNARARGEKEREEQRNVERRSCSALIPDANRPFRSFIRSETILELPKILESGITILENRDSRSDKVPPFPFLCSAFRFIFLARLYSWLLFEVGEACSSIDRGEIVVSQVAFVPAIQCFMRTEGQKTKRFSLSCPLTSRSIQDV